MKMLLALSLVLLIYCGAHAESIVDFIIANNPELQELKSVNRNILNLLKIEAKGNASYGQLMREGTSTLERAQSRYDVGISASIPLISPSEKAQRKIAEEEKERLLRVNVADLIMKYKAELKAITEESMILQSLYNEVQWMGKRVEAGVDSQKEYNQKLNDYLGKRKDHELRKEQVGYILEKILAYVTADKRPKLRGMLNETPRN